MKERIAKSALVIGTFYFSLVVALYLLTGGFETELLGLRISLHTLNVHV